MSETEVRFPGHAWLYSDRNLDVRAQMLGLSLVIDCEANPVGRHRSTLDCTLDDASVVGQGFPGHQGRLQQVLEEIDAKLTGAALQIVLTDHGRVGGIEVHPRKLVKFENRRTRRNDAFLRMMVVRALAPLDLELPAKGIALDEPFVVSPRLATLVPVTHAPNGKARLVHRAEQVDEDHLRITSVGSGIVVPGGFLEAGSLALDAKVEGQTVFDLEHRRTSEALWFTTAVPTPSSGPLARRYSSFTLIRALAPDEQPTLAETRALGLGES